MKKIISIVLIALLLFSFCACGDEKKDPENAKIKIGVMQFGEFTALQNSYKGFVEGLKEEGFVEGENIVINYLSAAADTSNCPTIADTFLNDGSSLIFAIATPSILAAKKKTSTVPLVFTAVTDPVASGIVDSNEGSKTNITGMSDMNPVKEQIDLAHKLFPEAKNIAVLYCSSESNSKVQFDLAKKEVEALGLTCIEKTISVSDEIKSAIESLNGVCDVIYVPTDNTLADAMTLVSNTANELGIPVIAGEPGMVEGGALATFGVDYFELGKTAGKMAAEILKSDDKVKKAGELPIGYQVEGCKYVFNKNTLQKLNVTIPADIKDIAEFIE